MLHLSAFSPHPSTPPHPNPPPSPTSTLSLDFVHVSFIVVPPQVFSVRGLRLYFPTLEPWVARSVSLLRRSTQLICTPMWDHRVRQPPFCRESSPPSCPSPPLLWVWTNVSSLSPWLSDFHAVRFSQFWLFLFLNCCCPSFGCVRRHSVSPYAPILAGSL